MNKKDKWFDYFIAAAAFALALLLKLLLLKRSAKTAR